MSFMDKAKDAIDKIEDKIPASVKDKIPDSVKDKLGIEHDDDKPDAGSIPADEATDPGSVSPIAAGTTNEAADVTRESSTPSYKPSDGTDPHESDAPGAGRGGVSDITKP